MEASETPQFPLDGDVAGVVRALGDRLVIEQLTVEDERAARVVRERAEAGQTPARTVRDAVEIGARVLDREDAAAEVDYVRAEFERHAAELRDRLARALEAGDQQLAERIAASFDDGREGSVPQQFREGLRKALEEQRTALSRLFSAEDGVNPLHDFKIGVDRTVVEAVRQLKAEETRTREKLEAVQQEMVRLTEQTEARRKIAEAEEAGTRKGRTFEERVHDAIDRIAAARGDAAGHVGNEPGKGGTKKGDTVVEVDAAGGVPVGRIVFESKDSKLSKKEAWDELNAAMAERDAAFAVLVVAGEERVPSGRQQLHEYEGDKLIVAVDSEDPDELGLELAYRYARCRLVLRQEGELEMDAPAVRDAAAEALSALKQAQGIKLNLSKAENGIASARSGLEEMAEAVKQRLERIESLVAESE